jgi:hypothetical protein
VELRLGDLILRVLGESDSPIATLLKSGALDLSKPGNLIGYIPKRPPFVVSGSGDRIVLDLMKHPAVTKNPKLHAAIKLITPLVTVGRIDTQGDHLCIGLSPMPFGFKQTLKHVRDVLI